MVALPAIPYIPRSALIAAGAVIFLLVLWAFARLVRRRHVVVDESESIRIAVIHLGRIADSIDHLALAVAAATRARAEDKTAGDERMSALRR